MPVTFVFALIAVGEIGPMIFLALPQILIVLTLWRPLLPYGYTAKRQSVRILKLQMTA